LKEKDLRDFGVSPFLFRGLLFIALSLRRLYITFYPAATIARSIDLTLQPDIARIAIELVQS
jgi:hypothetical protein